MRGGKKKGEVRGAGQRFLPVGKKGPKLFCKLRKRKKTQTVSLCSSDGTSLTRRGKKKKGKKRKPANTFSQKTIPRFEKFRSPRKKKKEEDAPNLFPVPLVADFEKRGRGKGKHEVWVAGPRRGKKRRRGNRTMGFASLRGGEGGGK